MNPPWFMYPSNCEFFPIFCYSKGCCSESDTHSSEGFLMCVQHTASGISLGLSCDHTAPHSQMLLKVEFSEKEAALRLLRPWLTGSTRATVRGIPPTTAQLGNICDLSLQFTSAPRPTSSRATSSRFHSSFPPISTKATKNSIEE